jgi:O-antigen ligase
VSGRLRIDRGELLVAAAAAVGVAVVALAASTKLGLAGLLAPLALVGAALLLRWPVATLVFVVGLVVLCEGPSFGLLTFQSHLYDKIYGDLSITDVIVALAVVSVGLHLVRNRRPLLIPSPLKFPATLLVLAMLVGFITGHEAGGSVRFVLASEDVLAFLLVLPIVVANLPLERWQVRKLLYGAVALAILKAFLGLVEIAGGYGQEIERGALLTYKEPTANWLVMIAILAIAATLLRRLRPPWWMLAGAPLLLASLLLSYRRSFWIAFVLALMLVLALGLSPVGRRLLLPAVVAFGAAIWLLGSIHFQSQLPVVKRAISLQPARVEANVEDRYRIDERVNVLAEIRSHPITGLGMTIPWDATARPLPVEHKGGREYVHFAALWFWLKLGLLGFLAYVGMVLASLRLAWQAWRRSPEPALSAFGLASLCGVVGLIVIETTATFTGVDARFTILLASQVGLLALLARTAPTES